MMTNEEIVLDKLNSNRFLGKNPIEFKTQPRGYYWSDVQYDNHVNTFNLKLEAIMSKVTVEDRVKAIVKCNMATYHKNGRYQCKANSRRSTVDIWRIYKNYFGDVDIFTIMRALYQLVVNGDLNTYRCPDIRKRVFWYEGYGEKDIRVHAELGVPLSEWEKIGL